MLQVLSNGEKRALYLLNIIFEVEARKQAKQRTLFIVDDIADSFDYKNKYAIIEYLRNIAEESNFYQIVLTHNFDFFRTIQSRYIGRSEEFMIAKISDPKRVNAIDNNQTAELFSMVRDKNIIGFDKLEVLDQVNLMTPENIHFNSFMYEPILDMSDEHLRSLYKSVKSL